jgi:predicted RNA-binding Zn ribbon-like protein
LPVNGGVRFLFEIGRSPRSRRLPRPVLGLDLVNSQYWYGLGPLEDRLASPRWRRGFLARWGFPALPAPTADERELVVGLRGLLRRLIERPTLHGGDVAALNSYMAQPAVRRLHRCDGDYALELAPVARGAWAWVAAEVAASFAELFVEGEWERVRVCGNPDCRFAFYDVTKNGSRRWCAQTICGNRFKGRRFRERHRVRTRAHDGRRRRATSGPL